MRALLLSFVLIAMAGAPAMAQDDQPLFGSEGSGILAISLPETGAAPQQQAGLSQTEACTSEGCPLLQKAAMAAPSAAQQP
jgi:hypothetical protein